MANSKIVTYDLRAPGKNYNCLYEKIKSYTAWAHIQESVWYISTPDSCVSVRDHLKTEIDSNDSLFVAELTGSAAWTGLNDKTGAYLKEHL